MVRKLLIAGVVAAAIAIPAIARAHTGHAHKVMGTVSSIEGSHLVIKTTDGKNAMVMLDAKTKITRGKTKLTAADVKVGDRVVAEGKEEKEMLTAATVQVGTTAAAPVKK